MDERKIVKCKGCGAEIFFQDGTPWFARKVPMLIAVQKNKVKESETMPGAVHFCTETEYEKTTGYVSHFVNCPKAGSAARSRTARNVGRRAKAIHPSAAGRHLRKGVDGKPEGIPVELADAVIRIFDLCEGFKIPLAEAILEKMKYNRTRPVRHGGKKL